VRKCCALPIAVLGCLLAAGCGSSGKSGSGTTGSAAVSSRSNGEASKPAKQVVADAAAALRGARGYVMQGRIMQNGQTLRVGVVAPSARSLQLTVATGGASLELIAVAGGSYVRGNATFWRAHLGSRGTAIANRWIQVPASSAQSFFSTLGHFAPATLSRCLAEDHGTLTVAGRTTIGGRPAILIRDAGNAPGSSPGELAVAATGPPYPLQAVSAGGQRAGGPIDVCNDGKASDTRGTLSFSHYGAVPALHAPKGAVHAGHTVSA
jgi:hypothetical protein